MKSTYISAQPQEEGSFEAKAKLLADDHRVLHRPGACAVREPKTLQANLGTSVHSTKITILRKPVTSVELGDTQSDSIQYLNFTKKKDSSNIRFNIALPKIQFKLLFN